MKDRWQGVFPAITTQMRRDGRIDLEATAWHAHVLIRSGITGSIILGSLGENQVMTGTEKRDFMARMVKALESAVSTERSLLRQERPSTLT